MNSENAERLKNNFEVHTHSHKLFFNLSIISPLLMAQSVVMPHVNNVVRKPSDDKLSFPSPSQAECVQGESSMPCQCPVMLAR